VGAGTMKRLPIRKDGMARFRAEKALIAAATRRAKADKVSVSELLRRAVKQHLGNDAGARS
jgi:hypothetical protein